jgi:high-affinity nickel-transport protein
LTSGSTISTALALVLGLRHGLDADHLAAIDGLTRWTLMRRQPFARFCGALFSAGHGAVILAAALILSAFVRHWDPPAWLGPAGAAVSAAVLIVLSTLNLKIAFRTDDEHPVGVGIRSRIYGVLLRAARGWQVALVGGLFALSFDAIGLAALFAATASPSGGAMGAAVLALVFAAGMVAVDTVNGFWVVRLLRRSDEAGRSAARAMTLTVAGVGIVVGLCVSASTVYEPLEQWLAGHELAASSAVVGAILMSYVATLWARARRDLNPRNRARASRAGLAIR